MPTHLVSTNDFLTYKWDGGTTTQMLIAPKGSSLAARDFDFRVSCARVEKSGPFSDFSGYDRLLLLLNGTLNISYQHQNITLSETDDAWHFSGASEVVAELTSPHVDDFNLFVRPGVMKSAQRLPLEANQRTVQMKQLGASVYGVFVYQGQIKANEQQIDKDYPLFLSSTPLTLSAGTDALVIVFAVGCPASLYWP